MHRIAAKGCRNYSAVEAREPFDISQCRILECTWADEGGRGFKGDLRVEGFSYDIVGAHAVGEQTEMTRLSQAFLSTAVRHVLTDQSTPY